MNSSTFSFKTYAIGTLLFAATVATTLFVSSEWLIRATDGNQSFIESLDRFTSSEMPHAAFGDSHIRAEKIFNRAEMFNTAQGGDNALRVEALVHAYYADRVPGRVLLQAAPHWFAPSRDNVPDTLGDLVPFETGKQPEVWLTLPMFRATIYLRWKRHLEGLFAVDPMQVSSPGEVEEVRRWSDTNATDRAMSTLAKVRSHRPMKDPYMAETAASYVRMLQFLSDSGAETCLLTMPVSPGYLNHMNGFDQYAEVKSIFQQLSQQFDVPYVDISGEFTDLNLFRDQDHVNSEGAALVAPIIEQRCFN